MADDLAFGRNHIARLRGQETTQEFLEIALANEAHAGGVLLLRGIQAVLAGDLTHFGLGQVPHGEHGVAQLFLREHIEEVGLILIAVRAAQQTHPSVRLVQPAEMPRGDAVRAVFHCKIEEGAELDLAVAEHIGIRRAPALIFLQKM